jgi:hypothetical protein
MGNGLENRKSDAWWNMNRVAFLAGTSVIHENE